jgi:hypothetical protein
MRQARHSLKGKTVEMVLRRGPMGIVQWHMGIVVDYDDRWERHLLLIPETGARQWRDLSMIE